MRPTDEAASRNTADAGKVPQDSASNSSTPETRGSGGSKAKLRALSVLMGLETKPLPSNLSLDQLEPKHSPRTSCFDLAGFPNKCGWAAHSKCVRCSALLDLSRSTPNEKPCAIIKAQVGAAFHTTQCVSELNPRMHTMPTLPTEILDLVLEQAIENMRIHGKEYGSVICALMHTNSIIRAKVNQAFAPIGVFERTPCALQQEHEVCWSRPLLTYVWDAIESLCVCDFSLRRHGIVGSLVEPTCYDIVETTAGLRPTMVDFEVMVWRDDGNSMKKQLPGGPAVGRVRGDAMKPITVWEICWALRDALEQAWPGLRMLSPYQRALDGTFEALHTGAYIQIIVLLQHLGGRDDAHVGRAWRFSTRPLTSIAR